MDIHNGPSIKSERDALRDGRTPVALWIDKIKQRRKEEEDWRKAAQHAIDVFEVKRNASGPLTSFNILHANIGVEVPALFNSMPIPDIRKRYPAEVDEVDEEAIGQQVRATFQPSPQPPPNPLLGHNGPPPDQQMPVDPEAELQQAIATAVAKAKQDAKTAGEQEDKLYKRASNMLERSLLTTFDTYPFDEVLEDVVRHHCVTGRGVARVVYDPDFFTHTDAETGQEVENLGSQRVYFELVPWDCYVQGPGKNWERIDWIAFKHDLPADEVERLLYAFHKKHDSGATDDDIAATVAVRMANLPFGRAKTDQERQRDKDSPRGLLTTLETWEVWHKPSRTVWFVSEADKERPISLEDDPLGLRGFFPMPAPLRRIRRVSSLEPLTPYSVYESLAVELDDLTRRITAITKGLRPRALVDPVLKEALDQLERMGDGEFAIAAVPADVWTTSGGGRVLKDMIHHFPMDDEIKALAQLYPQRDKVIQTIYEVTGISDVLRGSTDPNETLGAQQLKANFGSQRTQNGQKAVANFARDGMRLKSEIICNHFTAENIEVMSGIRMTPEVEQILRDKVAMLFRIDIETDSTIRADIVRNQEQWTQFLNGTAEFAGALGQLATVMPKLVPHMVSVYGSFIDRMKLGRKAEDSLKKMIEAADEFAEASPVTGAESGGPSAEEVQMQQQAHEQQMQVMQADQQRADEQHQMLGEKHQMEMAVRQADMQGKQQLGQLTLAGKQADHQRSAVVHQQDMAVSDKQMQVEGVKTQATVVKARTDIAKAQMGLQSEQLKLQVQHAQAVYDAEAQQRQLAFDQHKSRLDMMGAEHKLHTQRRSDSQKARSADRLAKFKERQTARPKVKAT